MNGRSDSECREADDCTSFLFAIDYKRPLRKPTWVEVHFDLGMSNDDDQGPKVTWVTSPQAALIRYDQAAVMAGTQAYIDRIFADLAAYEADFDTERMAVLAALVGCPDDTNPDYDSESCWCVDQEGQRHGPYVEGDEYLAVVSGVRRVEGAYVHGQQHGTWIYRDQDGNEIRRELWKAGTQVGTKAPEDPNPHPMSRPPPDAGP